MNSQAIEDESAQKSFVSHVSEVKDNCLNNAERQPEINHASFLESSDSFRGCTRGCCPRTFQLLRVKELPSWANSGCVGIQDVIEVTFFFSL